MQQIIQLTQSAIKHFEGIISKNAQAQGIRLRVKKSGCSGFAYVLEVVDKAFAPAAQDMKIVNEKVIVFVDHDSADFLSGTVIDVADKGLGQKQVIFNNPNVVDACGCGESFTVKEKNAEGV